MHGNHVHGEGLPGLESTLTMGAAMLRALLFHLDLGRWVARLGGRATSPLPDQGVDVRSTLGDQRLPLPGVG
eukprot:12839098-Alexandrium_andersonii.AAC.1